MRAVAKRLKTQHELASELWATGDTAARLLATLIAKPKAFSADELDTMIHDIRAPKLLGSRPKSCVCAGRTTPIWSDGPAGA